MYKSAAISTQVNFVSHYKIVLTYVRIQPPEGLLMGPGESGHVFVRAWLRKQAEGRPGIKPLLLFSLQCPSLERWAPLVPSSLQARNKAKVPSAKSPLCALVAAVSGE